MNDTFDPTENRDTIRRQEVYTRWKKRQKVLQIVNALKDDHPSITPAIVIDDIRACRVKIDKFAAENPFYLDKRLKLILEKVENLNVIQDEMWSQYNQTDMDHSNVRATYLGNIQKNEMEQAKLLQLLGNASEIVTKLEQATSAQQTLLQAIRDVTSTCPTCANALAIKLKNLKVKKGSDVAQVEVPPDSSLIN